IWLVGDCRRRGEGLRQAVWSTRPVPRPEALVPGEAGAMRRAQAPSRGGGNRRPAISKPPAGVEPARRPYKGRVLAVDTTEAKRMETVGFEPTSSSLQARRSSR